MSIGREQVQESYYQAVIAKFKQGTTVPGLFRSFFTTKTTTDLYVATTFQKLKGFASAQISSGGDPNRNKFSQKAIDIYEPPEHAESLDISADERYYKVFNGDRAPSVINPFIEWTDKGLQELKKQIERAKEIQCAQVIENGIVGIKHDKNITYQRDAESLVDLGSGGYWDNTDAPIEKQLSDAIRKMKIRAGLSTNQFIIGMSDEAWIALKNTDFYKREGTFMNFDTSQVKFPQVNAAGATAVAKMTIGGSTCFIFTTDDTYVDKEDGLVKRIWNSQKIFIIPKSGYEFNLAHAGIKAIFKNKKSVYMPKYLGTIGSEYWIDNSVPERGDAHNIVISSKPLAVPVTNDMITTIKVLGDGNPDVG